MLTIKIFCLPESSQEVLETLSTNIKKVARSIAGLSIKDDNNILILFPSDVRQLGYSTTIFVEVTMFRTDGEFNEDGKTFAEKIIEVMNMSFVRTQVVCHIYKFDGKPIEYRNW